MSMGDRISRTFKLHVLLRREGFHWGKTRKKTDNFACDNFFFPALPRNRSTVSCCEAAAKYAAFRQKGEL
jgi:hypothetical protein